MSNIFKLTQMASGQHIPAALRSVLAKIETATAKRPETLPAVAARLVAVSKTKPAQDIVCAYENGQRYFGENYVHEMVEKAQDPDIKKLTEIKWHFIGHLQRNKVGKLLSVPHLYMVETVDSEKLALSIDKAWKNLKMPETLKIMVQVNTSQEENKSGCDPDKVVAFYSFVGEMCTNLQVKGLMTIGSFNHDLSTGPNPDFQVLFKCREAVCKELGLSLDQVELSMGMSADFEHAIEQGSTNIRVGSTIFGARDPTKKADVKSEEPKTLESKPESASSVDNMVRGVAGLDPIVGGVADLDPIVEGVADLDHGQS